MRHAMHASMDLTETVHVLRNIFLKSPYAGGFRELSRQTKRLFLTKEAKYSAGIEIISYSNHT